MFGEVKHRKCYWVKDVLVLFTWTMCNVKYSTWVCIQYDVRMFQEGTFSYRSLTVSSAFPEPPPPSERHFSALPLQWGQGSRPLLPSSLSQVNYYRLDMSEKKQHKYWSIKYKTNNTIDFDMLKYLRIYATISRLSITKTVQVWIQMRPWRR